jgi:hypothetical protein
MTAALEGGRWPGCAALKTVEVTGQPATAVIRAMSLADPAPRLRAAWEISAEIKRLDPSRDHRFIDGCCNALLWLSGKSDRCPGSGWSWTGGRPSPEEVDAEHHLLVGRLNRHDDEAFREQAPNGGAECGLWWALGRTAERPSWLHARNHRG